MQVTKPDKAFFDIFFINLTTRVSRKALAVWSHEVRYLDDRDRRIFAAFKVPRLCNHQVH